MYVDNNFKLFTTIWPWNLLSFRYCLHSQTFISYGPVRTKLLSSRKWNHEYIFTQILCDCHKVPAFIRHFLCVAWQSSRDYSNVVIFPSPSQLSKYGTKWQRWSQEEAIMIDMIANLLCRSTIGEGERSESLPASKNDSVLELKAGGRIEWDFAME